MEKKLKQRKGIGNAETVLIGYSLKTLLRRFYVGKDLKDSGVRRYFRQREQQV